MKSEIAVLGFRPPFDGETEDGIHLNTRTMADVFRVMGEENRLTAVDDKYWWVDYSGLSFYVERDTSVPQFPFQKRLHINKPIVRITVPTKFL